MSTRKRERRGGDDLGFLETGVGAGLEIAEVAKDALFEFFDVADGTAKGLEAESEGADDVGACYVEEAVPEDAGDMLVVREGETMEIRMRVGVGLEGRVGGGEGAM